MKEFYITFRSITTAQWALRLLVPSGIKSKLIRTPNWMQVDGCGYSLLLPPQDGYRAAALLRQQNVFYSRLIGHMGNHIYEELSS